jgi:hypothetical protein
MEGRGCAHAWFNAATMALWSLSDVSLSSSTMRADMIFVFALTKM